MIDNKDEQFPVVDEMGNILGAISRGHAHDAVSYTHLTLPTKLEV